MSRARLTTDERGAIALTAVMMALLLTAMLFYVVAIGESVLQRERMQDAADAAAFSAAVLHARGMNILALINMVMAALLAVLVALKLVELLTSIAIIAIAIASYFAPGLAGTIPELAELRSEVREAHDSIRPEIESALEALHGAASAVRVLVPAASQLRAVDLVRAAYAPPAQVAFAVPARVALPTHDDAYARLCEEAGDYVGDAVALSLGPFVPDAISDIVGDATADLTAARADWFCGASGSAPSTTVEEKRRHPQLATREQCAAIDTSAPSYDPRAHGELCTRAELDEADSKPDEHGHCQRRCDRSGPYAERDARARVACAPNRGDALYGFLWQERRFTRAYRWELGRWRQVSDPQQEEQHAVYSRHHRNQRPCGDARASVGPDWHAATDDQGRPQPLCTDWNLPRAGGRVSETLERTVTEVTHLFGCREVVKQRHDLPAQHGNDRVASAGEGDGRAPQALDDVELGEEPFQLRAAVIGTLPDEGAARLVALAARSAQPSATAEAKWQAERALGRVAIAQGEYYFALEHPEQPPGEWLWSMRWQARLRRVRPSAKHDAEHVQATESFSPDVVTGSLARACELFEPSRAGQGDSPCRALDQALRAEILH